MANVMRWRYGDTNPVMLPVESDQEVEIGDLIYLDTDNAKPVSATTDQGTLLLNQYEVKSKFVGVAMQASPLGESDSIRIATSGVFEYDCSTATFELGDLLGVDEDATGEVILDQQLIATSTVTGALGRCAKRVNPSSSRVLVDVVSSVMRGGAQEMS